MTKYQRARKIGKELGIEAVVGLILAADSEDLMAAAHGLEDAASQLKGLSNRREHEEIDRMMAL